jgi:hypothetical protein
MGGLLPSHHAQLRTKFPTVPDDPLPALAGMDQDIADEVDTAALQRDHRDQRLLGHPA